MRYWSFNAVHSILSASAHIDGELYVPVSSKRTDELITLAQNHTVRIHRCKDPSWKSSDSTRRYPVLVTSSDIAPQNIFRTIEHYLSVTQRDREFVLLLDGITDVGNIAAIFRSAYNFGVSCVVMSNKTGGDLPLLIRRSAGYYLQVSIIRSANAAQVIQTLKDNHFWVYGADSADQGQPLSSVTFDAPKCALVIGDEHNGLRAHTKQLCDFLLAIPQRAECESLNVSVAAGILLYEIDRQQHASDGSR